MSCYDLKYLNVDGEVVGARPISWSTPDEDGFGNDIDGNEVLAVEWMSTCPHCANLMKILTENVYTIDDVEHAGCTECGKGIVESTGEAKTEVVAPEPKLDVRFNPLSDDEDGGYIQQREGDVTKIEVVEKATGEGLDESEAMSAEELVGMLSSPAEFVDPVAEGTFDFEIDRDRTPGLVQSS